MKIGDTVRFLNSTGGGKVTRIDTKQNLVYVEDEDGFDVPVLIQEVVVIENVSSKTNVPQKDFGTKPKKESSTVLSKEIIQAAPTVAPEPIFETAEGETLKALLAFYPQDSKQIQKTNYDCYLINDSNYFLFYNIVAGEPGKRRSVANGLIEPNLQELLSELTKEDLNEWEHIQVQIIPFKKEKEYKQQAVIDLQLRLNVVNFYKLHSFVKNEYSDEPSMLINLSTEKEKERLAKIPVEEIKKAMITKLEPTTKPKSISSKPQRELIEVDLHINSLLDTTSGMSNREILQVQMDKFHSVLEENKGKKGQKIVFIHGKGEGVLRKEIEKELKRKYKHYYFQDASFREYGFGATMITIH